MGALNGKLFLMNPNMSGKCIVVASARLSFSAFCVSLGVASQTCVGYFIGYGMSEN